MPPKKTPPTSGGASGKRKRAETHTPIRLRFDDNAWEPRDIGDLVVQRTIPPFDTNQDLVFMALDIVEEAGGSRSYNIWGITAQGCSVLVRVSNFHPYFYIASPRHLIAPGVTDEDEPIQLNPARLQALQSYFNRFLPPDASIQRIEPVMRTPIMYYRPDLPVEGACYLKLWLAPGGNSRKAGNSIVRAMSSGMLKHEEGLQWRDLTLYESEVAPLQRFLADVPICGGAWVMLSPEKQQQQQQVATPEKSCSKAVRGPPSPLAVTKDWGFQAVPPQQRVSTCDIEVIAPWQGICCLSPDATQLADPSWTPSLHPNNTSGSGSMSCRAHATEEAIEAARRGDVPGLRMLVLDVCSATRDGVDRAPTQDDPIVCISCAAHTSTTDTTSTTASPLQDKGDENDINDEHEGIAAEVDRDIAGGNEDEDGLTDTAVLLTTSTAAVAGGPTSALHKPKPILTLTTPPSPTTETPSPQPAAVVFALTPAATAYLGGTLASTQLREHTTNARVVLCSSEEELLLTWQSYVRAFDPDVIAVYQVGHTLEAIRQRFSALNLCGGSLHLSRSVPARSRPMEVKRITMYSPTWVKSQSRMSSTSNQETFRADIDGRIVIDVLRQVLTNQNLGSYSLVDAVQSLLGETLEVLPAWQLARLAGVTHSAGSTSTNTSAVDSADALRIARYSMRRVDAVKALLVRLATIPDTIELARAVGLTIGQVMFNAQMIRTFSLLLRVAQRDGFILPVRSETSPLSEHTFILHPVEAGTTGFYRQPVAILDFASLYPSIFQAHNLCYTTLVHPEDVSTLSPDQTITTPTGAVFVKPDVRYGIIPGILKALVSARAATRKKLKFTTDPAYRAQLDARQKALKITANATYGFTGAQASPLQCAPLADSCLAIGAQACRTAKDVLEAAARHGQLTSQGNEARVIYGHTDSLFVLFPKARDVDGAITAAQTAAGIVSAAFPDPMEIKFERVCLPLMLLHVNRYAGRAFERSEDVNTGGVMMVKGLKSMWRQTAPLLRTTLHGALVRILMYDDIPGAVTFVESEILRLLSGRVEMHELAMTGGLWRVTGQQVERAAEGSLLENEEVRGPHASLAVKLQHRDPGRNFLLGERLSYVLLSGYKLQDEGAEDPLVAAKAGLQADLELYWKNKMQKPLQEVFATVLTPQQLQSLMNGPHTMVKVDQITEQQQQQQPSSQQPQGIAASVSPLSPPPGGKTARSPSSIASMTSSSKPSSKSPLFSSGRQKGLTAFFKTTAKCLGCKRSLPGTAAAAADAPGLCDSCSGQTGKWEETYLGLLEQQEVQELREAAAHTACQLCHSGVLSQPVLCENAECPVTYARLSTAAKISALDKALRRMDIF